MKIKRILLLFVLLIVLSSYSCKKISESNNQANVNNDIIDNNSPEEIIVYLSFSKHQYGNAYNNRMNSEDIYSILSAKYNKKITLMHPSKPVGQYEQYIQKVQDDGYDTKVLLEPNTVRYILDDNPNIKIVNFGEYLFPLLKDYLAVLYDIDSNTGLLEDFNDYKRLYNDIAIDNKIYSAVFKHYVNHAVFWYDYNDIKKYNLEDPLELFYKGKWDTDTLIKYLTYIKPNSDGLNVADDYSASFLLSNLLASSGELLFDNDTLNYNLDDKRLNMINDILLEINQKRNKNTTLWGGGPMHGHILSRSIYCGGGLVEWDQIQYHKTKGDFRVVPFPIDNIKLINEPYSYVNGYNEIVEVTQPIMNNGEVLVIDDKPVYGIDLSESNSISLVPEYSGFGIVDKDHNNTIEQNKTYLQIASDLNDFYSSTDLFADDESNDINVTTINMIEQVQRFDWSTALCNFALNDVRCRYFPGYNTYHFNKCLDFCFDTYIENNRLEELIQRMSNSANKLYDIVFNTSKDDWVKDRYDIYKNN